MERGFWDIPVPADATEVAPKTLIAPLVGYDGLSYRLGYGGGFFDRTLAKFGDGAQAIGIGYSMFQLATIHPQPHDIRMAAIVTERGVRLRDTVRPASEVCYMDEAEAAYAGFASSAEIAATLSGVRAILPPERVGLLDYALWRLDRGEPAPAMPPDLATLLPRVRDDALHAALTALRDSI